MRSWLIAVALFASLGTRAEEQSKAPTRLEAFSAKTGSVVIRAFGSAGSFKSIDLLVQEVRDGSNPKLRALGLVVDGPNHERAYIDADEVSSLLAGLDTLAKIDVSITTLPAFEADYKTKGGFSLTSASSEEGIRVGFAIGGKLIAYCSREELPKFRELVVKAQTMLAAMGR